MSVIRELVCDCQQLELYACGFVLGRRASVLSRVCSGKLYMLLQDNFLQTSSTTTSHWIVLCSIPVSTNGAGSPAGHSAGFGLRIKRGNG